MTLANHSLQLAGKAAQEFLAELKRRMKNDPGFIMNIIQKAFYSGTLSSCMQDVDKLFYSRFAPCPAYLIAALFVTSCSLSISRSCVRELTRVPT